MVAARPGPAAFASRLASRFRAARGGRGRGHLDDGTTGAAGAAGFGGFGGFGELHGQATGTISVVDGQTLYVLSAAGSLVKVTLTPSTTITRNATAAPDDLRPGDTVVVQGSTSANGNVSATSIAATAPGISSTGGRGFGGAGGWRGRRLATTAPPRRAAAAPMPGRGEPDLGLRFTFVWRAVTMRTP